MVLASFLLGLAACSALVNASVKEGIFDKILSITPPEDSLPETPSWSATVEWSFDEKNGVKAGDTFVLHMPYVYKFTSGTRAVDLVADSVTFANCDLFSGDNVVAYSELKCTATSACEKVNSAKGTVEFPFTFNAGLSSDKANLEASTVWHAGSNVVKWTDGSKELHSEVYFDEGNPYLFSGSVEHGVYWLRKAVMRNTNQHLVLGPSCDCDGMSGYIEIQNPDYGVELDCLSVVGTITKQINDFYFPESAESCSVHVDECCATRVRVSFDNIPSGFRPYINVDSAIPHYDFNSRNQYSYGFSCGGIELCDSLWTNWYMYKDGETGGDGEFNSIVVTTVTDSSASTTGLTTITGPSTNTIVVTVPGITPSETSSYDITLSW